MAKKIYVRKIKDPEKSRVYRKEAQDLMEIYSPIIYPCQHCNHPVADGYCCTFCGTNDPGNAENRKSY